MYKKFMNDLTKLGLRSEEVGVSEWGFISSLYVPVLAKVFILRKKDKRSMLEGWTKWLQLCSIDQNGLNIRREERLFDLWSNDGLASDHKRTRELLKQTEIKAYVYFSVEEDEEGSSKMHKEDPHYEYPESRKDLTDCLIQWEEKGEGGCFLIIRRAKTRLRKIYYPTIFPPLAPGYTFTREVLKEKRVKHKTQEDEYTLKNLQRMIDESRVND